jgi:magnesium chelatase accessory protein
MHRPLRWEIDGPGWPHHQASRFVQAGGLRWHVQQTGIGCKPCMLLLHGTGASVHSWAGVATALSGHWNLIMVDLPGHGFTQAPVQSSMYSLPGMAQGFKALLDALEAHVDVVVGHSAGAALAAWLCLEKLIQPRQLVGINAAVLPLHGIPGHVFTPMARLLWASGVVPPLFARAAQSSWLTERLLAGTGSAIPATGKACYTRLLHSADHVGAALAMMAHWNLPALAQRLPALQVSTLLLAGTADRTVPPEDARRVQGILQQVRVVNLAGLGHLAHEEDPAQVAAYLRDY